MACLFVTCRWSCSHNEPNPKQRFLYYLATCVIFTWPYLVYCGKIGQLLTFMTQYNLCSILRKLFIYFPLYFSAWKVEHHDVWLDGKRQDFVGSDHRQMPRCSLRHLRLHDSHHGGGWKYLKFNQKFCQTFCLLVGLCWRGHWVCGGQAASGTSSCCRIWDMPSLSPAPPNDQNSRFFFILADLEKCTLRDPYYAAWFYNSLPRMPTLMCRRRNKASSSLMRSSIFSLSS